jgi:nucleoside-diphosphate-sugar epimerase
MLAGERILVTGSTGQIGLPLTEFLARDNEVWALARFADPASREQVAALGAKTCACDLGSGDLGGVPEHVSYVLHLAAFQGADLDYAAALRTNAEGTGFLMQHCRSAKAVLVMSTHSVYRPQADPLHRYTEDDPLGDAHPLHSPTYSIAKIAQEAVARYCARSFAVPTIIPRMNVAYGPRGGLPAFHLGAIASGQPVTLRWDPCPYSPIHQGDINAQVEALLHGAGVPATTVNWCGDDVVSAQEWCRYLADLVGTSPDLHTEPVRGTQRGAIGDTTRRLALTGPCRVNWREGFRDMVAARTG